MEEVLQSKQGRMLVEDFEGGEGLGDECVVLDEKTHGSV
jgi:hypothetical protein